jgi:hypothetical protein
MDTQRGSPQVAGRRRTLPWPYERPRCNHIPPESHPCLRHPRHEHCALPITGPASGPAAVGDDGSCVGISDPDRYPPIQYKPDRSDEKVGVGSLKRISRLVAGAAVLCLVSSVIGDLTRS